TLIASVVLLLPSISSLPRHQVLLEKFPDWARPLRTTRLHSNERNAAAKLKPLGQPRPEKPCYFSRLAYRQAGPLNVLMHRGDRRVAASRFQLPAHQHAIQHVSNRVADQKKA